MIPTTADAVAASVACAAVLGLPTDNPVVVAEGYSVRVRLDPAPVLTRVVTVGRILRGDPLPWMQREVAVSRFLAAAGAPVVPPWPDAGPHAACGLEVSLWQWLEPVPLAVSPAVYGVLLKELHDALEGYDAELPVLVGPLTDIATALRTSDDPVLAEAADRLVPLALTWPRRPVHGDAHTGNVLTTRSGPRWTDFEDICLGPLEWDLASQTLTAAFIDAYPGEIDRTRLEECRDLRCLQILATILTDDIQDAGLYDQITARLRTRAHG
jgi:Phosphotransferase enzyme family